MHKKIKINLRLNVEYNKQYYKSNIQGINDEYIEISIPMKRGKYISLHQGEKVNITFLNKGDLYKFTGEVIGHRRDKISIILIKYPKQIYKIQRRDFVRIKHLKEIEYIKADFDIEEDKIQQYYDKHKDRIKIAYIIDISGGGCRVNINDKFKLEDVLLLTIHIEDTSYIIKSKIVRVEKNFNYGIQFLNLSENERDKLIKYIFKIMRLMRQNDIKEN